MQTGPIVQSPAAQRTHSSQTHIDTDPTNESESNTLTSQPNILSSSTSTRQTRGQYKLLPSAPVSSPKSRLKQTSGKKQARGEGASKAGPVDQSTEDDVFREGGETGGSLRTVSEEVDSPLADEEEERAAEDEEDADKPVTDDNLRALLSTYCSWIRPQKSLRN